MVGRRGSLLFLFIRGVCVVGGLDMYDWGVCRRERILRNGETVDM